MEEPIAIPHASTGKTERYQMLVPQVRALVEGEPDIIANTANIVAALREVFGFFWIGIYFVRGNQLVLGPFQGPVACTRIAFGSGVCGTSWKEKRLIRVDDVDTFPGHIACNPHSRSEIVLPACNRHGEVFLVLDIDSDRLSAFDDTDEQYLLEIIRIIEEL